MQTLTNHLQLMVKNRSAVPIRVMDTHNIGNTCANCFDLGVVYVFGITGGPFKQPHGVGAKYIEHGPNGEGWYSGKLEADQCPACANGRYQDWLMRMSGLSGTDLTVTISTFSRQPGKTEGLKIAHELLAMNRTPSGFYTFRGGFGTGKTHLLKSITNGFRMVGVLARYITAANMLDQIREKYGEEQGTRAVNEIIEDYASYRVLCIDEVDRVQLTPWAKEKLFTLIDSRYNDRDHMLTVLAHNAEIPADLGYLKSRMSGGIIVEVAGDDMRPAVSRIENK